MSTSDAAGAPAGQTGGRECGCGALAQDGRRCEKHTRLLTEARLAEIRARNDTPTAIINDHVEELLDHIAALAAPEVPAAQPEPSGFRSLTPTERDAMEDYYDEVSTVVVPAPGAQPAGEAAARWTARHAEEAARLLLNTVTISGPASVVAHFRKHVELAFIEASRAEQPSVAETSQRTKTNTEPEKLCKFGFPNINNCADGCPGCAGTSDECWCVTSAAQPAGEPAPGELGKWEEDALEIVHGLREYAEQAKSNADFWYDGAIYEDHYAKAAEWRTRAINLERAIAFIEASRAPAGEAAAHATVLREIAAWLRQEYGATNSEAFDIDDAAAALEWRASRAEQPSVAETSQRTNTTEPA